MNHSLRLDNDISACSTAAYDRSEASTMMTAAGVPFESRYLILDDEKRHVGRLQVGQGDSR